MKQKCALQKSNHGKMVAGNNSFVAEVAGAKTYFSDAMKMKQNYPALQQNRQRKKDGDITFDHDVYPRV